MRKTKIICTMGPSTDKGDVMEQLVREGMDVARFNSHMDLTMSREAVSRTERTSQEI